jgi:hypothetical protein
VSESLDAFAGEHARAAEVLATLLENILNSANLLRRMVAIKKLIPTGLAAASN